MTWVTPPTFVNGNPLPDTDLNKLSDNLDHLGSMTVAGTTLSTLSASTELARLIPFVGVEVYKTANQAVSGPTVITFDAEFLDTDDFHDNVTTNTRLTVPANRGGYYLVYGHLAISNAVIYIKLNGTTDYENGNTNTAFVSKIFNLSVGDYVELYYNGGVNTVLGTASKTRFGMYYLGA